MPVRRPRSRSLAPLLRAELRRGGEDPGTAALIERLRDVRRRGWFSRRELLLMCCWKSPRALPLYSKNPASRVVRVSRAVLATRSERRRMAFLTSLSGVSVAMASAILTLIDPRRYGVLDIRVWQLLFRLGAVRENPGGRGFSVGQWAQYLAALRAQARRLGVSARAVEWALFRVHRRRQIGRLYDPVTRARRGGSRRAAGSRPTRGAAAPRSSATGRRGRSVRRPSK